MGWSVKLVYTAGVRTGCMCLQFVWKRGLYLNEKHVIFSCIGTQHLRHQFIHLFDHISEGDIKGFVFQHNSNLLVQLSIFFIYLFVGTNRLSSHARLEAFVIRTKLNQGFDKDLEPLNSSSSLMCNFENGGFCWFPWSRLSNNASIILNIYNIL